MITPEEFIDRWDVNKYGPLNKFNRQDLMVTEFSDDVKGFLSIGGLPETPPPYLEFSSPQIRPITNVFDMPQHFKRYWFLGSTGSGDPICITEKEENIVFLNNGDNYKEIFVNSSINQFAECILAYVSMIDKAIEVNGEDAFIDNDIPKSVVDWLKEELERIDSKCMQAGFFWSTEYENLFE
ncbi:SUKH-4 family immunity protein [Oceanobacillus senegalensis]|uniref:SUKH-4 family immunity protein n=1 Tax=Oceanobacillus senegalensis TaxID=1936063 RepID=UPI000A30C540|nr:SUKH-4 family immunity protein [Oceanobacillus senegalensis]